MEISKRDGKGTYVKSLKDIRLSDGRVVGVFQGERGDNPALDILVKYEEPGKRVRTPQHLHWAIDLLLKKEHNKVLTKRLIKYLLEVWEKTVPFRTKAEQQACELRFARPENLVEFKELDRYGEYSVEFIAHILELIMIQEKTGSSKAHMFKGVLEAILNDKDIFSIVSAAGYKG